MKVVAPQVKEGTIDVDQSALTGESLPVTLRGGDAAQMGATVVRGETHAIGGMHSMQHRPAWCIERAPGHVHLASEMPEARACA